MKCRDCGVWQLRRGELVDIDKDYIPRFARWYGKNVPGEIARGVYGFIRDVKEKIKWLDINRDNPCRQRCILR